MKLRNIALLLYLIVLLTGCDWNQQEQMAYYADTDNYVTVSGVVSHIQYNEDRTALYIEVEACPEGFSDTAFKLVGECLTIAAEKGIDEALSLGDEITFTCAPRYFGDGYVVPIAAITVGEQCFLDFEEGYDGLMNWLA